MYLTLALLLNFFFDVLVHPRHSFCVSVFYIFQHSCFLFFLYPVLFFFLLIVYNCHNSPHVLPLLTFYHFFLYFCFLLSMYFVLSYFPVVLVFIITLTFLLVLYLLPLPIFPSVVFLPLPTFYQFLLLFFQTVVGQCLLGCLPPPQCLVAAGARATMAGRGPRAPGVETSQNCLSLSHLGLSQGMDGRLQPPSLLF